jgi:hypothetical protein
MLAHFFRIHVPNAPGVNQFLRRIDLVRYWHGSRIQISIAGASASSRRTGAGRERLKFRDRFLQGQLILVECVTEFLECPSLSTSSKRSGAIRLADLIQVGESLVKKAPEPTECLPSRGGIQRQENRSEQNHTFLENFLTMKSLVHEANRDSLGFRKASPFV